MLYGFFLVIHVIVSVLLVVAVLMQASKGGGLAGIAGGAAGGASSAMFGGRQAGTMLHKLTVGLALVFGINALLLGGISRVGNESRSVTMEAIASEQDNPLEFLGESSLDPTEQQLQQAKDTVPTPTEEDGESGEAAEE
ncbi:preprotein translocase subunit SecG [bacterium BMS3Bbin04]|nr:preprotein translocase subunit SecG [bacterium BMS3Bbin04]